MSRTRTVVNAAGYGGKSCGLLSETKVCHRGPCPIHCDVSAWTEWSACSKSCGKGDHSRSRRIVQHAQHGGYQCPDLWESRHCNQHACPVDCVVSGWSAFGSCNKSCGTGAHFRSRNVMRASSNGGKACPGLSESKACNVNPCPIDCEMTEFSLWSACSKTCGKGIQVRTRKIRVPNGNGGKDCPAMSETRACPGLEKCDCDVKCEYIVHDGSTSSYGGATGVDFKTLHPRGWVGRDAHPIIRTWHTGNKLDGKKHHCKMNHALQRCECKCYEGEDFFKGWQ